MNNIIKQTWRDSSSLILLAKQCCGASPRPRRHNYDILVQTRPARATTFANSLVFPGGVAEAADGSADWLRLIKSFGFTQEHFDALHHPASTVSPIFQPDPVLRHISLRITAIRETFEELGILVGSRTRSEQRSGPWATVISDFDVKEWQVRVSRNPEELLTLCRELGCYPDIWALHYWSNWLTPVHFPKRFNTAFFVAGFKDKPEKLVASSEVVRVEWSTRDAILEGNRNKEISLFPPQVYELSRLSEFTDAEDLLKFAAERSCFGNELLFPVHVEASNGWVHLLPGDDLYPSSVDYHSTVISWPDRSVSSLRAGCSALHRLEAAAGRTALVLHLAPPRHVAMLHKHIDFVF